MPFYMDRGTTRIALLRWVGSITAPTTTEISNGLHITPMLTPEGIALQTTTTTMDRSKWKDTRNADVPARFSQSGTITGYRDDTNSADLLWRECSVFGATKYLVIRRGIASTTAFAAGQAVEVYKVRIGMRYHGPTGTKAAGLFVPYWVQDHEDEAVVI